VVQERLGKAGYRRNDGDRKGVKIRSVAKGCKIQGYLHIVQQGIALQVLVGV